MSASSFSNHLEVSEIAAIRADAERFCEDDIVRLCDFTLAILGECCGKAETCERECIYRWKARAAEAQKDAIARCAKVCDDFAQAQWRAYKTGDAPQRANPHVEGMSDGADNCSRLIRALSPPGEAG